ncbi:hypothetical protein SDC9_71453 [bioreactor metagenome]|uniref:YqgU-like 6-bladed beta-propeller domain-containing protein n=1 Tax=bioreactor metagenome TaxID=1076179 RepID=A0A644YFS7_9ZZZZ
MGKRGLVWFILSLSSVLILAACTQRLKYPDQPDASAPNLSSSIETPSISKDEFLYTVGWLDDRTLLVALEKNEEYGLDSHDLLTGEDQPIRTFSDRLVFAALSENGRRMLVQVANQQGSNVMMIDKSGKSLADFHLSEGVLTNVSWNPENEGQLFLSVQKTMDRSVNNLWDLAESEWVEMADTEGMPVWYSENMYLHMESGLDGASALVLSDVRFPGKDTVIDREILAYGLEGESVWVVTPSDFNEEELIAVSYYPLLIAQGYVALPRITDGSGLVIPEFKKGNDSDETFAVIPKQEPESVDGVIFELAKIDFSGNASEVLTMVERMAPISVSPEGTYVLYGERYEYLYDVEGDGWIQLTE